MATQGPISFIEGIKLQLCDWYFGTNTIQDRLFSAIDQQDFQTMEWCVHHGANMNLLNVHIPPKPCSPFFYALFYKNYRYNLEYIDRLINLGTKIILDWLHNPSQSTKTLLHAAIEHNSNKLLTNYLIDLFIDNGVDVNAANCGYTALWMAAKRGLTRDVQALINAGADLNKAGFDSKGAKALSPIQIARKFGHNETVELLRQYGAWDPEGVERQDSTSLSSPSNAVLRPLKQARMRTPVQASQNLPASKRARKR